MRENRIKEILCLWIGIATMLSYGLANAIALQDVSPQPLTLEIILTLNFAIACISIFLFSCGIAEIAIEKMVETKYERNKKKR